MRWLYSITDSMAMNLSQLWEIVKDREAWYTAAHGVKKSQTRLSDWKTITGMKIATVEKSILEYSPWIYEINSMN